MKPLILIVEDDTEIGSLLKKILKCQGYEILYLFLQNPEKVYSRENLYELTWKDGYYGTDHTVNVHVSNLRKKIKEQDGEEKYVQSVYGLRTPMTPCLC